MIVAGWLILLATLALAVKAFWDTRGPSAYSEAAQLERLRVMAEDTEVAMLDEWWTVCSSQDEIDAIRRALRQVHQP